MTAVLALKLTSATGDLRVVALRIESLDCKECIKHSHVHLNIIRRAMPAVIYCVKCNNEYSSHTTCTGATCTGDR